jgi:carboxymethylenebutenolidase
MLIEESHVDVSTKAGGDMSMSFSAQIVPNIFANHFLGIFIFHPKIDGYPKAKFPGVVVFSEIYQGRQDCLDSK